MNRRASTREYGQEERALKPFCQTTENRIRTPSPAPKITRNKDSEAVPLGTFPNGTFHASTFETVNQTCGGSLRSFNWHSSLRNRFRKTPR